MLSILQELQYSTVIIQLSVIRERTQLHLLHDEAIP